MPNCGAQNHFDDDVVVLPVSSATLPGKQEQNHHRPGSIAMSVAMSQAPEFPEGLTWFNTGKPLRFAEELRGQVVVLDFWTYCCINCMHVLPDLKFLEEKYAHDPVTIIGVHSNKYINEEDPENIRKAIFRYGIKHPVVVDFDHAIWDMYGIDAWPTLVVIDSAGRAIGALPGEGHREDLDKLIAALLEIGHEEQTLASGPLPSQPERQAPSHSGLRFPGKVIADQERERLFIADSNHNRILVTNWSGELLGFFGSGLQGDFDGSYEDARFNHPQGLAFFGSALYIADTENHMVRRADLLGFHVDTVLGNGMIGYDRHGGHHGTDQLLNSPWDLAFLNGMLYIAMAGLHQIWVYDPQREIASVVAGTGRENITDNPARKAALAQPSGLAAANGKLYFADSETSSIRIYDPQTDQVSTLVGKGLFTFGDVDGPTGQALLQHPLGVAADADHVYIADTYNHKIRSIDLNTGLVSTLAGTGIPGLQDGDKLALYEPGGIALAGKNLFIADTNNDRVIRYRLDTGEWREIIPTTMGKPLNEAA